MTDPAGAGIYANIGGILMGSMLPYMAYMDPMGMGEASQLTVFFQNVFLKKTWDIPLKKSISRDLLFRTQMAMTRLNDELRGFLNQPKQWEMIGSIRNSGFFGAFVCRKNEANELTGLVQSPAFHHYI